MGRRGEVDVQSFAQDILGALNLPKNAAKGTLDIDMDDAVALFHEEHAEVLEELWDIEEPGAAVRALHEIADLGAALVILRRAILKTIG